MIRVRASYAASQLTTPKSGKGPRVPMAPDVAASLAKLGSRPDFIGDEDQVFPDERWAQLTGPFRCLSLRRLYVSCRRS